jgi:hypothetical protein
MICRFPFWGAIAPILVCFLVLLVLRAFRERVKLRVIWANQAYKAVISWASVNRRETQSFCGNAEKRPIRNASARLGKSHVHRQTFKRSRPSILWESGLIE